MFFRFLFLMCCIFGLSSCGGFLYKNSQNHSESSFSSDSFLNNSDSFYSKDELFNDFFHDKEDYMVFFDFDRSKLFGKNVDVVNKFVDLMKSNTSYTLTLVGHCDERGTREYNLALGERRAYAVKSHMVSSGISASRIETSSKGKDEPYDLAHEESAYAKNRRVEFNIMKNEVEHFNNNVDHLKKSNISSFDFEEYSEINDSDKKCDNRIYMNIE